MARRINRPGHFLQLGVMLIGFGRHLFRMLPGIGMFRVRNHVWELHMRRILASGLVSCAGFLFSGLRHAFQPYRLCKKLDGVSRGWFGVAFFPAAELTRQASIIWLCDLPMMPAAIRHTGTKEKSMGKQINHLMDEADIGSGEKTPGQKDVEKDELALSPQMGHMEKSSDTEERRDTTEGRILQEGTHLARILAVPAENGLYEAQVYVRLTREPEVAETYIPVGLYPSEAQAWEAAEERARRAFNEREF
jgi:hypothetical protein